MILGGTFRSAGQTNSAQPANPRERWMLIRRIGILLLGAAAITVLATVPANAADSTVTFTTTGGTLSVAAPASATLSGGTTIPGGTVTGALGTVVVTDARGYSATTVEFQITRWLALLSSVSTIGRESLNVRVSKDY